MTISIPTSKIKTTNSNITVQNVWEAKRLISSVVKKTPLIYSKAISKQFGAEIYLKYEHLHESGAFKFRGAVNAIYQLTDEEKSIGVTTFSTGNHGFAVALAAKKLGIRSRICVSEHVPKAKIDAIKSLDAELEIFGNGQDDAEQRCYQLEKEQGLTVIPPFDHPHVIAGQGTIALEILEDLPSINCVIGGLSGGGLLSGIGLVMKNTNPDIGVIGVSMEKGAAMNASLKAGRPVSVVEEPSIADSLLGGIGENNQYTFNMVKQFVDQSYLIPEETIKKGMAYLYKEHRIVVEGAAAIGVGAILDNLIPVKKDSKVVIIVSGNNVDTPVHANSIKQYL
ncbi:threonine dehydratase [Lysinibacillus composti]|uniref:threonine ammonia-lyase n=1 Tax=Lysinibacillus composti TaxID=720633 RepID=A0A3N9UJK8_9BACI|nr:hydroxyectoine utilization dehydratase EutB [Lysinibacillus composti]MBM7607211.1 threonine dehydratase [Lysinibacillus composti]RQW76209.1 hydroxyectoine utilization dehydratase EutB [Lysinibacillus composti]